MFFRAWFHWRQFPPARGTRIAVVLLALLQFVAPSWHICDLGLSDCCCPAAAMVSPGQPGADANLPPCCRHKAHLGAKTGSSCPDHPYTGFCLARFLESYFGSTAARGPELVRQLRLVSIPDCDPVGPPSQSLPAPAGRGPPLV